MLPVFEAFDFILQVVVVVTAAVVGAVDVVVEVADDVLFNRPRFFSDPIEPFNKSGLSTSGPPNSVNWCNQQHSIASIPSSTYWIKIRYLNFFFFCYITSKTFG